MRIVLVIAMFLALEAVTALPYVKDVTEMSSSELDNLDKNESNEQGSNEDNGDDQESNEDNGDDQDYDSSDSTRQVMEMQLEHSVRQHTCVDFASE